MTQKQKTLLWKNVTIVLILLFVGILGFFGIKTLSKISGTQNSNNPTTDRQQATGNRQQDLFIGDEVVLQGNLNKSDQLGLYTHTLVTSGGAYYGLISRTLNLNDNIGEVEVSGKVDNKRGNLIIIDVNAVKKVVLAGSGDVASGDQNISYQSSFYFPGQGFYLDFAGSTGFYAQNADSGVSVFAIKYLEDAQVAELTGHTVFEKMPDSTSKVALSGALFTMSSFECKTGNTITDCQEITKNFKNAGFETFTSANGLTFYKLAETQRWFFTNSDLWGYYINPTSDEVLLQYAKYIYPFSKNKIVNDLLGNITQLCQTNQNQLASPNEYNLYLEQGRLLLKVLGKDQNQKAISCVLEIKLGQSIYAEVASVLGDSQASTGTTQQPDFQLGTGAVESINSNQDQSLSGKVLFPSNRGFSLYLPANTAYEGFLLQDAQDFGIDALNCNYVIHVSLYTKQETLNISPDLRIFECKSKKDLKTVQEALSAQGLAVRGSSQSDMYFVLEVGNQDGQALAQGTLVN